MIAGLVLAAGRSSRMGRPKIGLDVGGRPMLTRVVDAALSAGLQDVVVVLAGTGSSGRDAMLRTPPDVRSAILALGRTGGVRVAQNPDAASGQASSLRAGLRAMRPEAAGAVVLLADQPLVRVDAIRAVVVAFETSGPDGEREIEPVIQASYGGIGAHPTLLARAIWPAVEALTGDEGARALFTERPERRRLVEVGGEPPLDVDTESDYAKILSRLGTEQR